MEEVLTVKEVAKLLRVSPMTIYRLVKSGELQGIRLGRSYRIPVSEIERKFSHASTYTEVKFAGSKEFGYSFGPQDGEA